MLDKPMKLLSILGLVVLIGCASRNVSYPPVDAEMELERALQLASAEGKAVLVHLSGAG